MLSCVRERMSVTLEEALLSVIYLGNYNLRQKETENILAALIYAQVLHRGFNPHTHCYSVWRSA